MAQPVFIGMISQFGTHFCPSSNKRIFTTRNSKCHRVENWLARVASKLRNFHFLLDLGFNLLYSIRPSLYLVICVTWGCEFVGGAARRL